MTRPLYGIPAAAGYPQYSGNLIHPIISQKLIEEFYCTSIFGEISTTEYQGEFSKGGDQITFWRAPEIMIRDYVKNGEMKHDTLESRPVTITIDKAKYFSFKIDDIDAFQMQMWSQLKSAALSNASRAMVNQIDCELLGSLYADVISCNRGTSAGASSAAMDLGDIGAPVEITAENILQKLVEMSVVLDEQCVPQEGRFVVLPHAFKNVLMNSPLACAYCSGLSQSLYVNGRVPGELVGFKLYFSHNVPMVDDPTNRKAWHIVAGLPMATVFATQMEKMREFEGHDSFDKYFQGLQVYGFDVMYPKALVDMYATLAN